MDIQRLPQIQEQLRSSPAEAIVAWALETFGERFAVGTSFGAEAMVLMDIVHRVQKGVPFVFLDTGFHFHDTLALVEQARARYDVNLIVAKTDLTPQQQAEHYGDQLFLHDPDRCCELRKVEPMRRALAGFEAWATGRRSDQNADRANARAVEWDAKFELFKVNPLKDWSWDDIRSYLALHEIPYNRLHDMGYPSIGCAPCTQPVKPGQDLRAGRWAGTGKSECGLHK